jgi:hypothetical protein
VLLSVLDPQIKPGFFHQNRYLYNIILYLAYITGGKNFFDLNDVNPSSGSPKRTMNSYKYEIYSFFLKREAFQDLDMDPLTGLSMNPIGIQIGIYNTLNN